MKREEGDQDSETKEQEQINMTLCLDANLPHRSRGLQRANVETARPDWHALVKQDQTNEQNETTECKIDRDLPSRRGPVSAPPDPDQQKRRDEREFVKRIKEKYVERSKRADRAAGNEKKTGVERVFVLVDLAGEPNGRQGDGRSQQ